MTTDIEMTDRELREVYELLTREQLIDAIIRKHKEFRLILKNRVIPSSDVIADPSSHICMYSKAMNQVFPRLCVICSEPEGSHI